MFISFNLPLEVQMTHSFVYKPITYSHCTKIFAVRDDGQKLNINWTRDAWDDVLRV